MENDDSVVNVDGFKQHIKNMLNKFSSYWFIYESYHPEYKEYLLFQKDLQMYIYIYIQLYIYIQYPPINKIFPRVRILWRFLK